MCGLDADRLPLPRPWPEVLAISHHTSDVTASAVERRRNDGRTPVIRHCAAGELDAEEQYNSAERESDVHRSRRDVVVLHPPAPVAISKELIEDVTHQDPGQNVHGRVRRHVSERAEDERDGDLAHP